MTNLLGKRQCETEGCRKWAEPEELYCLLCQLTGRSPDIQTYGKRMRGEQERLDLYEISCMMCGRSYERKLSPPAFKEFIKSRRGPCVACGGFMQVLPADAGLHGSAAGSRLPINR